MDIVAFNLKSYVVSFIALCGQMKRVDLVRCTGSGPATYVRRIVKELCDEKILIEKKSKTERAKVIRLAPGFRDEFLDKIPFLQTHYNMTTTGGLFKTDNTHADRMSVTSDLIQKAIENHFKVNGIGLEYRPGTRVRGGRNEETNVQKILSGIAIESGSDRTEGDNYKRILEKLEPGTVNFFTSPLVKMHKDENDKKIVTIKINQSRSYGHLFGNGLSYAVYDLKAEKAVYSEIVERRYRNYLENIYREIHGPFMAEVRKEHVGNGACIFRYRKEQVLCSVVKNMIREGRTTFAPLTVFSNCHALDDDVLKIITAEKWKSTLLSTLFTETEIENAKKEPWWCDAIRNGKFTSELISMDMKKVIEVAKTARLVPEETFNVICKKENKAILREIFEKGNVMLQTV